MRRLILWDIDGTLITSRGVGRRAMEDAAGAVAGLTEVPAIEMSGKTDPQILREIFRAADHCRTAMGSGDAALRTAPVGRRWPSGDDLEGGGERHAQAGAGRLRGLAQERAR